MMNENDLELFKIIVKDLKPSVDEDNLFIIDDKVFIISPTSIRYIVNNNINPIYNNKMISVSVIKGKSDGYMCSIGLLECNDSINNYRREQQFIHSINIFNKIINYFNNNNYTTRMRFNIQNSEDFNNIMNKSTAEGTGRYIIDRKHVMLIAPCMIPMTKTSIVDLTIVDLEDGYLSDFIVKKSKNEVHTIMKFLYA